MPRRLASVRSLPAPRPAPPPARAAAPMSAEDRLDAATYLSGRAEAAGLDDHHIAWCLAGLDACYHTMDVELTDRTRTLSRARKLYREALKRAVARRGKGAVVTIGPVRLRIDGYGDLEMTAPAMIRGPFKMEAAR